MLEKLKLYLSITGTDKDPLLELLLAQATASINRLLDVDSFDEATYTETVKYIQDCIISVRNYNITTLTTINGDAVVDPTIVGRHIYLSEHIEPINGFYTVVYTAGYVTIPSEIEMLYILYTIGLYNKRNSIGIRQYRLGEETITYADSTEYEQMDAILGSYKKAHVIG